MEDYCLLKGFISPVMASKAFEELHGTIKWHRTLEATDGTPVTIKRGMAYAVNEAQNTGFYNYAGLKLPSQGFTDLLESLMTLVEVGWEDADLKPEGPFHEFNSVLLNLYENGREEIKFHSDREPQLGPKPVIATLNLGASRTFSFRHKETKVRTDILLENGDLLMMLENCQENYFHGVLKDSSVTEPRISLTFRYVYNENELT